MIRFNISSLEVRDLAYNAASAAALLRISATVHPTFSSVKGNVEHGAEVRVFSTEDEALTLWAVIQGDNNLGCAWWDSPEHVGCSKRHPRLNPRSSGPPPDLKAGRHNKGFPR